MSFNEVQVFIMYIGYYRTSTDKQELGILAQKRSVHEYVNAKKGTVINEFEEHESGARDRPILQKALDEAKLHKAIVVVAKLDRLSRSIFTIFKLRQKKEVEIVVADNPDLFNNSLTLAVYAGMAQHEREMISSRTKAALAELKAKGVKLGNPQGFSLRARQCGLEHRRHRSRVDNAINDRIILQLKLRGFSDLECAVVLNDMGIKTPKSGQIYKTYVCRRHRAIREGTSTISWTPSIPPIAVV